MHSDQYAYVYILSNWNGRVLYTGVTNDLKRRLLEHRERPSPEAFTARNNVDKLIYFERFTDIEAAILREKQIKAGSRGKKIGIINSRNPAWVDLSASL